MSDSPKSLPSIDLDIRNKLADANYRQEFFLAESSALIAKQLIALRKRRGLNQTQMAEAVGTGQPAISRVFRADYQNWSFNTLRKLAAALDARLRVSIEASEDVLDEYVEEKESEITIRVDSDTTSDEAAKRFDTPRVDGSKSIGVGYVGVQ